MHNPGMARNKSSSRPGIQLGIRVTDSEQVDYLYVANREGFETIQKWMLHLADKRARTSTMQSNQATTSKLTVS